MKIIGAVDVGAPDPELNNSPVIDAEIEDEEFSGANSDTRVCYFNGVRYPVGDLICCRDELLCCENGVWVRSGSCYD